MTRKVIQFGKTEMRIGNDRDKIGRHRLSLVNHVRFAAEPAKAPKAFAALLKVVILFSKARIYSVNIIIKPEKPVCNEDPVLFE